MGDRLARRSFTIPTPRSAALDSSSKTFSYRRSFGEKRSGMARAKNCFGIMLNVLDWNRPALAFFQKHKVRFLDGWKTACLDGEALQAIGDEG